MSMRLLLVDDHAMVRDGIRRTLVGFYPDLQVDEASNCAEALALATGRDYDYDLILLDLRMPGLDGLAALVAMREAFPAFPVVVLSGEDDPRIVTQAIEKGAMGYIHKSFTSIVMIKALEVVLAGGVYVPPNALKAKDLPAAAQPNREDAIRSLSERQLEVLRRLIRGTPNKVIASQLAISESTVKVHVSAVLRALNARNRTEVVFIASAVGFR